MNTETKDAMEALGMKPAGTGTKTEGREPDYKALYEKAQHDLDVAKVEQGRVRKLNEELQAKDARIAELEKMTAIGSLPDNLKEGVPDEMKEAALLLAQGVVNKATAEQKERIAMLEKQQREEAERRQAERSEAFAAQLMQAFPAFVKGISAGGAFKTAWEQYQVNNAESVSAAFAACDFGKMSYHIKMFCEQNDVDPSGGRDPNATPDPRPLGGGTPRDEDGRKKTYTMQEYESLTAKARQLRDEYRFEEYRKLSRELEDAWSEGRVKQS